MLKKNFILCVSETWTPPGKQKLVTLVSLRSLPILLQFSMLFLLSYTLNVNYMNGVALEKIHSEKVLKRKGPHVQQY